MNRMSTAPVGSSYRYDRHAQSLVEKVADPVRDGQPRRERGPAGMAMSAMRGSWVLSIKITGGGCGQS
jgi:hypothetical protein